MSTKVLMYCEAAPFIDVEVFKVFYFPETQPLGSLFLGKKCVCNEILNVLPILTW